MEWLEAAAKARVEVMPPEEASAEEAEVVWVKVKAEALGDPKLLWQRHTLSD